MTVVDLFAGVGGFTQGFLRASQALPADTKFEVRLLADLDQTAAYTFKKNFPQIPYWPIDLAKVDGAGVLKLLKMKAGELDFLIGGPPCQGFSSNGKRWLEDNRNKLLAHFIALAQQVKPRCVIIENVPTALSAWQKLFDEQLHEALPGYVTRAAILNASAFGMPQIRRRAFVVALREDLGIKDFTFPIGSLDTVDVGNDLHTKLEQTLRFISVAEAIDDLPTLKPGEGADGVLYPNQPASEYQRHRRAGSLGLFNHVARAHSPAFLRKISVIKPGEGNADLPDDQRFSDNYFSQAYARLHPQSIGFTVTANFRNPGSGRFTHYRDSRSITVREAARLQSFDDKFIFHGYETDQERHVGNAVPPLMAEALAEHFGVLLGGV